MPFTLTLTHLSNALGVDTLTVACTNETGPERVSDVPEPHSEGRGRLGWADGATACASVTPLLPPCSPRCCSDSPAPLPPRSVHSALDFGKNPVKGVSFPLEDMQSSADVSDRQGVLCTAHQESVIQGGAPSKARGLRAHSCGHFASNVFSKTIIRKP